MRTRAARLAQQSPWKLSRTRADLLTNHQPQFGRCARSISIQATPSTTEPNLDSTRDPATAQSQHTPDARFEVLGSSSSLLSVSLSASQPFHTRRGTLVGVSGSSPDNAISTLSPLSPLSRGPLGIPFLYQKITSTAPIGLLIATRAPHTSLAVVNLDGRVDWKVAQRNGLLAWTGHTLAIKPGFDARFGVAHWGNSTAIGRGLLALAGAGNIYQVKLNPGEQYVAHPSNVLAYTINANPPLPFRFKSTTLRLQIPSFGRLLPDTKFFRAMRESDTWKRVAQALFTLRTYARRTIWGDRLFIRFYGPTTVLLQSRGSRLQDVLSSRDVNEIADSPAGSAQSAVTLSLRRQSGEVQGEVAKSQDLSSAEAKQYAPKLNYANVGRDGKVSFSDQSQA